MIREYGIEVDVSLLLRETPNIVPHMMYLDHEGRGVLRIPFFWEDDIEMYNPNKSWNISNPKYHVDGLKIFNFHPMYIYLNSNTMHNYEKLKFIKPLPELDKATVDPYINKESEGAGTFFTGFINCIVNTDLELVSISEVKSKFEQYC
jgi:hypothetical protein